MRVRESKCQRHPPANNFRSPYIVLVSGDALTGRNHDHITQVGHFVFVVRKEFARIALAFLNLVHDAVAVDRHVDGLLHARGDDGAHQGTTGPIAGWIDD